MSKRDDRTAIDRMIRREIPSDGLRQAGNDRWAAESTLKRAKREVIASLNGYKRYYIELGYDEEDAREKAISNFPTHLLAIVGVERNR